MGVAEVARGTDADAARGGVAMDADGARLRLRRLDEGDAMETLAAFNQADGGCFSDKGESVTPTKAFDPGVDSRCVNLPDSWLFRTDADKCRHWNEVDAGQLRDDIARKAPAWWSYATGPRPLIIMDIEEPGLTLDDAGASMVELTAELLRAACPRDRKPRVGLYDSTCCAGSLDVVCPKCYVMERKIQTHGVPVHGGEESWGIWATRTERECAEFAQFGAAVLPMLNLYQYHDGIGGIPVPSDALRHAAGVLRQIAGGIVLWGAPGWKGSGGTDPGWAGEKARRLFEAVRAVR